VISVIVAVFKRASITYIHTYIATYIVTCIDSACIFGNSFVLIFPLNRIKGDLLLCPLKVTKTG